MTPRREVQRRESGQRTEGSDQRSPPSPEVLVGVPAYNEADTIAQVVGDALTVADAVVVADDGSDDHTARLAREAGATVVEHGDNRGYGTALATLFEEAARRFPAHLVVVDGDGQHDPSEVPALVERQRQSDAEIVIGSRFAEGSSTDAPLYRRFGLAVVNWLVNLSLGRVRPGSRLTDTQSGFRAYDPRAVRTLAATERVGGSMAASIDILYVASDRGFLVEEVGVEISYDVPAASSEHPIAHGASLVSNALQNTLRAR